MLLQFLITFCRVVDEGSFTRAAESLSLSQPTATKQVQRLEAIFGTQLIDRSQRELTLTPAGEVVYMYAQRVLGTLQKCREDLEALQTPGRGILGIGSVPTITLYTLPRIIESFRAANPLVNLHVRSGTNMEVIDLVLHSDVDIGFTTVPVTHANIVSRPLFRDRIVLACSPQTHAHYEGSVSAAELARIPMIAYERRSHFRSFISSSFEAAGISPNIVMEFDSHEAVKTMVQLGLGIAMVPESVIHDDLKEGRLATLQIEGFGPLERTTSAIIRRDRHQTQALTDFLRLLDLIYPADSGGAQGEQAVGV